MWDNEAIEPVLASTSFPLSFNQERRVLFETVCRNKGREPVPFNVALGLKLLGDLDHISLTYALNQIVNRHAVLRAAVVTAKNVSNDERRIRFSAFSRTGLCAPGIYQQVIRESVSVSIKLTTIDHLSQDTQKHEIERLCNTELAIPFDYGDPPLMRAHLLRLGKQEHLLVIIMSHLVVDLRSLVLIVRELRAFYDSALTREPPHLPPLRLHFPDFARWQNQLSATPQFHESVSFWRRQWSALDGGQVWRSEFPFAITPSAKVSHTRGVRRVLVGRDVSRDLKLFSRKLKITPNMLALSAFLLLLHKYTHKPAISVWMNFANRSLPGTQDVIGWFVNSHIIGAHISLDCKTADFLLRVRAGIIGALAHQEVPRRLVGHTLGARPSLSDTRILFDSDVSTSTAPKIEELPQRLIIQRATLPVESAWARGLQIGAYSLEEEIVLLANYASDWFAPTAIDEMLDGLVEMLCKIIANPTERVARF